MPGRPETQRRWIDRAPPRSPRSSVGTPRRGSVPTPANRWSTGVGGLQLCRAEREPVGSVLVDRRECVGKRPPGRLGGWVPGEEDARVGPGALDHRPERGEQPENLRVPSSRPQQGHDEQADPAADRCQDRDRDGESRIGVHEVYRSATNSGTSPNRARPLRNCSSTRNAIPTISPPVFLTRSSAACAVPPVASRSSTMSTR